MGMAMGLVEVLVIVVQTTAETGVPCRTVLFLAA